MESPVNRQAGKPSLQRFGALAVGYAVSRLNLDQKCCSFCRMPTATPSVFCAPSRRLVGKFVVVLSVVALFAMWPPVASRSAVTADTSGFPQPVKKSPRLPADQPSARTDQNSLNAHAQLLDKAKRGGIDIYFEGDSITRRWGATDYPELLANWNQNFFGWNAANFGWGGDTIQNILWRLNHGELDGVNPKVIVLLAGANNLGQTDFAGRDEAKIEEITKGYKAILETLQAKASNAIIIITAIFPRNDIGSVIGVINGINENLAKFADGRKVRYLNVNPRLADKDGNLFDGMMNADKLHPTIKGYQVWADGLRPIFAELLGPAGEHDHAPPPTGDPKFQQPAGLLR
jgi:lysophospholipase L1-like esterase